MGNYRKLVWEIGAGAAFVAFCVGAFPARAQQLPQQPAQAQAPATALSRQATPQQAVTPSDEGTKGTRVFGVMPNNLTVEGAQRITKISTGEKFKLVAEGTFDPYEFCVVGILAGIGQETNDDPSWGQGMKGYGLRYAADYGDLLIGNFMVGAVLPTALRQDPRYFQKGKGGFWPRAGYALSRIAVTRGDSGRTEFNMSEVAGTGIGAVISSSYRPGSDRTVGQTSQTWATQLAVDAFGNELKEFWPDIRRHVFRKKN